ncbi:hydrogenase maturation protease [bacterium]|nr:hydrogenase maturation protease [bacterium]
MAPRKDHDAPTRSLVIGCGNLLRGDDAAGPVLIRRLRDRGMRPGVECVDAGTGGIDVSALMRGRDHVVIVDACCAAGEAGAIYEVPGEDVQRVPPPGGINLHAMRWDHALALARRLLKEECPRRVTVFLVEAEVFEPGAGLSSAVSRAVDELVELVSARLDLPAGGA